MPVLRALPKYTLHLGIFLLPALALQFHKGISVAAAFMWLSGLALAWPWHKGWHFDKDDQKTLAVYMLYPLATLISMAASDTWRMTDFDKSSRFILVLPALFGVCQVGISRGLIFLGFSLGAIGAGLLAIHQVFALSYPRAEGYTNAIVFGDLSALMGILTLIPLVQWFMRKTPVTQNSHLQTLLLWLALPSFILGVLGGYFSGTRAVLFCAPAILTLLGFYYLNNHLQRVLCVLAIGLALLVSYAAIPGVQKQIDSGVLSSLDYAESGEVGEAKARSMGLRLEMWRTAILLGMESPWAGKGPNSFREEKQKLVDEGKVDSIVAPFGHAHSDFLTLWAETGLPGVLSLLIFYLYITVYCWRRRTTEPALAICGILIIAGFASFGLSQAMLTHNLSTTFLIATVSVILGYYKHRQRQQNAAQTSSI